jgi:hypothetical protein
MTNLIDFMMFVGCVAIVILAVWGTFLGIQILIEAFKKGHMGGMDACVLVMSMSSILLATMSVSDYWKRIQQVSAQHDAIEGKIRQAEQNLDKKLNRIIPAEEWEKTE